MKRRNASVLVGVLWCMVLLSVMVISVLHTARLDLMVVKNQGDRIQAHYFALAGIEKAKAILYQEGKTRSRSAKNHTGELYNSPQQFRDIAFGRGHYSIFRRGRQDENGGIIFGVSDEESRVNLNAASPDVLKKLPQIPGEVVASIQDWRDADNEVTPGGAEAEYYLANQPPYLPRNGPFQTTRELLMVKGVAGDQLFGKDEDQNGLLGDEANGEGGRDPGASIEDGGWAALLTTDSTTENRSAAGETRVNVQSGDEQTLTGVNGITTEIARAIVSYRGQNELKSIADLLDVTAQQPNQPQLAASPQANAGNNPSGPKVISQDLLEQIADEVTVAADDESAGLININTAGVDVLACLPGVSRDLAQAIISRRQSDGFFANIAGLLRVTGMTTDIFKQVAPLATARSETYRITCEGRVDSSGARQRIQVVVHVGHEGVQTLSYREDL